MDKLVHTATGSRIRINKETERNASAELALANEEIHGEAISPMSLTHVPQAPLVVGSGRPCAPTVNTEPALANETKHGECVD